MSLRPYLQKYAFEVSKLSAIVLPQTVQTGFRASKEQTKALDRAIRRCGGKKQALLLSRACCGEIKNIRTEVYNGARPDYSKAAPGD